MKMRRHRKRVARRAHLGAIIREWEQACDRVAEAFVDLLLPRGRP